MVPDVTWLDQREQRAWLAYIDLSTLLDDYLDRQLERDAGMSHATYNLLSRLSLEPGRALRMTDLAEHLRITRSRLSHALPSLELKGWVRRVNDPGDRRGQMAQLTDAGQARLEETAPGHVAAVRQAVFDRLSAEQVDQLAAIGEAVVGGLIGENGSYRPGDLPWRRR